MTLQGKFYQGKFRPKNPSKYKGDYTNIVYRSSWECRFMSYIDRHPHVTKWSSEEIIVPYRSCVDGKMHRYFPDFYVEMTNALGKREKLLIEIKPYKETIPPKVQETKRKKPTQKYLREVKTYGTNSSKWKAAEEFCKDRGWKFVIMTEKDLGLK